VPLLAAGCWPLVPARQIGVASAGRMVAMAGASLQAVKPATLPVCSSGD